MDGRPTCRNKEAFSTFPDVLPVDAALVSSPSLFSESLSADALLKLDDTDEKWSKFLHAVINQEWFSYLPSASTAQKLCPDHVFIYGFCVTCRVLRRCTKTKQLPLLIISDC